MQSRHCIILSEKLFQSEKLPSWLLEVQRYLCFCLLCKSKGHYFRRGQEHCKLIKQPQSLPHSTVLNKSLLSSFISFHLTLFLSYSLKAASTSTLLNLLPDLIIKFSNSLVYGHKTLTLLRQTPSRF